MAHFELDDAVQDQARIKVIGVGGAGGNAVNTMIANKVEGVEFYVLQIGASLAANEIQVLTVALAAIAQAQGGPALKDDVLEDARFGQRGQEMEMDGLLHQILVHARFDAAALDEGVDRALKPFRFAAHLASLRPK